MKRWQRATARAENIVKNIIPLKAKAPGFVIFKEK
jgi:hypothetical protein